LPDETIDDLFIDREQIRRAIFNILDNSIHALLEQASYKSQKIIVRTKKKDTSIYIEISDNGPGVDPVDAEHIFEPYFTKAPGGTGLGLSIVESIIREHNGYITLDRSYKDGAKFVIELPITVRDTTKRKIFV
jgi:two-component system, NtrC family, nitrogen regulation sensor histidine kinase NtrY